LMWPGRARPSSVDPASLASVRASAPRWIAATRCHRRAYALPLAIRAPLSPYNALG
jgi:hypothetical protein